MAGNQGDHVRSTARYWAKDDDTLRADSGPSYFDTDKFLPDAVERENEASKTIEAKRLTVFETVLTLVAANVAGSLLGLPYALHHLGLLSGLPTFAVMSLLCHWSSMMYIKVKDLTPKKTESVYEIAFLLFGRPTLIFVCLVYFMGNFGTIIMFYMTVGSTLNSLIMQAVVG